MAKDRQTKDPLAEARWEQVRGDEEGIREGWSGGGAGEEGSAPHHPPVDDEDAGLAPDAGARNGLTGDAGDPGGER